MSKDYAPKSWNRTEEATPKTEGEGDCRKLWKGAKIIPCAARVPYEKPMHEQQFAVQLAPHPVISGLAALDFLTAFQHSSTASENKIALDYFKKGAVLFKQQNFSEALDAFNEGIQYDPDNYFAHVSCGVILNRLGLYDEAIDAFDSVIRRNKKNHEAHFFRGDALIHLERYTEALADFGKASGLQPQNTRTRFFHAYTLSNLNLHRDALDAYDAVFRLDAKKSGSAKLAPDEVAEIYYHRGASLLQLGRYAEALSDFDNAINHHGNRPLFLASRGWALTGLMRFAEALETLDRAVTVASPLSARMAEGIRDLRRQGLRLWKLHKIDAWQTRETETERLLIKNLQLLLKRWGAPEHLHQELINEFENITKERTKIDERPKWNERGKYAELKDLSAPLFLKHVYADKIAPDGTIKKEAVRSVDNILMARVENYISTREDRKLSLGDAEGLRFITSPAGRPKRADLG